MTEVSNETRFLHAIEMGLGAWQWGDRVIWGYGQTHTDKEIRESFDVSLNSRCSICRYCRNLWLGLLGTTAWSIFERNRPTRAGGDQILPVAVAIDKGIYPARIEGKSGAPRRGVCGLVSNPLGISIDESRDDDGRHGGMCEARLDADRGCFQLRAETHAEGLLNAGAAWNSAGVQSGALQPAKP